MPTWLKNFWHTQRLWALLAIAVIVVAVGVALFWPVTDLIATHDVGQIASPQRAAHLQTARDAARGRLLQLGAGLFADAALVYTARNFTLSRTGQVTDRYTKAIEQLGSGKLDVRIGAIYALERVARDSATDHPTVIEVLAAFIREHSREQWPLPGGPGDGVPERATRPDVQAAVYVIGRRNATHDSGQIDLTDANLTHADLGRTNLSRANLSKANLSKANLSHAYLKAADLSHAYLKAADLRDADLGGGADLRGAYLRGADLTDADLTARTSGLPTSPTRISPTLASAARTSPTRCIRNTWQFQRDGCLTLTPVG